jgi:peptidoglycan hydrolase-like protein with peptidoglycan-binding domain
MMSEDVMTTAADPDYDVDPPPRVSRRRLLSLFVGAAAVAGTGGGYWYLTTRETTPSSSGTTTGPAATAEVTRETLTSTETWSGKLGHGTPFAVTTKADGTITWLAEQDSKIKRGSVLFRVDEHPVVALKGGLPMYRDLSSGSKGSDVKQLEENLTELGYDGNGYGFDVDKTFTWYTGQAVKEWQADVGSEKTGTVKESDVVYLTRNGRVDGLKVAVGDTVTSGTEILGITGSKQIVSLEVDVKDRDLVSVDTEVVIGLPGDEEVQGTVTSANVVEDTSGDGGGEGGGDEDPGAADTITEVEVTLNDEVDESLLGSPVDIVVEVDRREDVLAVPVGALLALSEGGFGVEVVQQSGSTPATNIVPVDAGMFANGKVEITGAGIDEGTVVGVAGR